VEPWTPAAAATLVLVAELGFWSHEVDEWGWMRPWRHLAQTALTAIGSAAVVELALDLTLAAPLSGAWLLAAGTVAAVAAPAILLRLAQRDAEHP